MDKEWTQNGHRMDTELTQKGHGKSRESLQKQFCWYSVGILLALMCRHRMATEWTKNGQMMDKWWTKNGHRMVTESTWKINKSLQKQFLGKHRKQKVKRIVLHPPSKRPSVTPNIGWMKISLGITGWKSVKDSFCNKLVSVTPAMTWKSCLVLRCKQVADDRTVCSLSIAPPHCHLGWIFLQN